MARRGDLIRCTVKFEEKFKHESGQEKVPVCFTLNGERIVILEDEEDPSIVCSPYSFFPYIGLSDGCSVLAKVCECIFKLLRELCIPRKKFNLQKFPVTNGTAFSRISGKEHIFAKYT